MSLPTITFTDPVYRAHHPRWAYAPESGEGASRHGGRFNRPGTPALYTALRPETAWLEAQQGFTFKAQPMTVCAYDVDCADVVDLTSHHAVEVLGIIPGDLGCPWEDMADRGETPPTWKLADRLIATGAAGVIVPSFAHRAGLDDCNLVFWQWERVAASKRELSSALSVLNPISNRPEISPSKYSLRYQSQSGTA